jgi:hypothetical protein
VRIITPADGEVETAARDHEGGADRDDGDEGRAGDHVQQIRRGKKIRIDQRACDHKRNQRDKRRERPHIEGELALFRSGAKHGFGHAWPAAISAALSS